MNSGIKTLVNCKALTPLLGWLALLSFFTFILSLVLIPWIIGRLPQDTFVKLYHEAPPAKTLTFGRVLIVVFRNGLGLLFLLAGIIMLFLPGQGLLTILLGILLISFPGKKRILQGLVCQPRIQQSMDWLRTKWGKPPFAWPESQGTGKKH